MYTEKDNKVVSILGTDYNIKFVPEEELAELNADGACDSSIKLIRVGIYTSGNIGDLAAYQRKVLRHEIIHAFLYESGLAECSGRVNAWAANEEMVDFFALQYEKIHKALWAAGAIL